MIAKWKIRLGAEAEEDFRRILLHTRSAFGSRQAELYEDCLLTALDELRYGPQIAGSASRNELSPGLRALHVARGRRKGRHIVFYQEASEKTIEVVRILHDAMDFKRHLRAASKVIPPRNAK